MKGWGALNNFLSGPESRTKYPTAYSPASAEMCSEASCCPEGTALTMLGVGKSQTHVILRVFMKITEMNFRLQRGKWDNKNNPKRGKRGKKEKQSRHGQYKGCTKAPGVR